MAGYDAARDALHTAGANIDRAKASRDAKNLEQAAVEAQIATAAALVGLAQAMLEISTRIPPAGD